MLAATSFVRKHTLQQHLVDLRRFSTEPSKSAKGLAIFRKVSFSANFSAGRFGESLDVTNNKQHNCLYCLYTLFEFANPNEHKCSMTRQRICYYVTGKEGWGENTMNDYPEVGFSPKVEDTTGTQCTFWG